MDKRELFDDRTARLERRLARARDEFDDARERYCKLKQELETHLCSDDRGWR